MRFNVTVHLSNDFERTTNLAYGFRSAEGDSFDKAATEGVYDGMGMTFDVEADTHMGALETAYAICNSAVIEHEGQIIEELHCPDRYREDVIRWRSEGNRSMSMGDMAIIHSRNAVMSEDGRYICASAGFARL